MHLMVVLSLFVSTAPIAIALEFSSNNSVNDAARQSIETSGEILIGGLFPVHSGSEQSPCSNLNHERGIHRLEAMMYAVDLINRNSSILANYTVGVNVRDTCGVDTHALEESVHFIKGHGTIDGQCGSSNLQSTLFGVVGAASSGVSIQVANLLRLFQITQISYASTSPDLSDRQKYDYFLRTVPPDTYQALAMVDVIRFFNWSSVFGLYSEGNYGTKGMEVFENLAKSKNICMVASYKIAASTNFDSILKKMTAFQSTRVVVLFLSTRDLSNLLKAVKLKINSSTSNEDKAMYRFRWLASDFWGTKGYFITEGQLQDVARGAITLTPQTVRVHGFENYFRHLTPESNTRNPWFVAFWEDYHKCSLSNHSTNGVPPCSGNETLLQYNQFDDKIPYVVDAVFSFAHAITELIAKLCKGANCNLSKLTGKTMLDMLQKNFSFIGELGLLKFDENGSTVREYEISEFVADPIVRYKRLGSWFHKLKEMRTTTDIVSSSCSDTCRVGQIKVPKQGSVTCCFTCRDCGAKQYVEAETSCKFCNKSEIPNSDRTGCQQLPDVPIASSWVIVMITLSSLGVIATVLVILIFLYHNNTAVVKASGRELTYPLLIGIIFCYTLPFVLLAEPTETTCGIIRFGFGFSFFICYAALVTKTNRIERVFRHHTSIRSEKLVLLGPSSQLLILAVAVLIEALLALIGLFIKAPSTEIHVDEARGQKFKLCVLPLYDTIVAFGCNMLLIVMCTVFAFRTRKVPACFNEAKYIGFVMYTTCVLWIAFVTIYFGLSLNYVVIALCMNIFLSATSILAGVFGPKIYIIIFRPGRNNRSRSGLAIRHVYSNETFSADLPEMSRKMTTLTELNVDVMTQTEDFT